MPDRHLLMLGSISIRIPQHRHIYYLDTKYTSTLINPPARWTRWQSIPPRQRRTEELLVGGRSADFVGGPGLSALG